MLCNHRRCAVRQSLRCKSNDFFSKCKTNKTKSFLNYTYLTILSQRLSKMLSGQRLPLIPMSRLLQADSIRPLSANEQPPYLIQGHESIAIRMMRNRSITVVLGFCLPAEDILGCFYYQRSFVCTLFGFQEQQPPF